MPFRTPAPSLVRRLLPGLGLLVVLPLCATLALLWRMHHDRMAGLVAADAADMAKDLAMILELQADGLEAVVEPIAADPAIRAAIAAGDSAALESACRPVFTAMRRDNHVTHLYFSDRGRICLLRAHAPAQRGDRIDRFTTREAERTRTTVSGLEFGPRGTFTLRVVQPVIADGTLLGFVEVGKEIEDALNILRQRRGDGSQMAVIAQKGRLDRPSWEESQRTLGRETDWNRLRNHVVVYASQGHLPDAFAAWATSAGSLAIPHREVAEVASDGRLWRVMPTPLLDASGARVGDLLAMRDITAAHEALVRQMLLGGTIGLGLVALVLFFMRRLLARADRLISDQQELLRTEHRRLGGTIEATRAGTWEWDVDSGAVLVNGRWGEMLGHAGDEASAIDRAGWERLYHPDDLPVAQAILARHFSGELPYVDHECRLRHRDGRWVWVHCRGRLSPDTGGPRLMYGTHVDITARKDGEAERERLRQQQQASELAELLHSNRLVGLGTLMAGLAHEINHPAQVVQQNQQSLRAIVEACVVAARGRQGNAVGLLTWEEVATLAPSLLDDLGSATTYLQELVDNVRTYANPGTDCCEIVDEPIIDGVCMAALRLVASFARRSQVRLASPLIGRPATTRQTCSRLQQVVVNLLINAIQASRPGDCVHLETTHATGSHRIAIDDEGSGIDAEVIARLGQPFVTTRTANGGSGLGLYLCQHLVTGLGGRLVLAPRPPRGTRASVEFTRP